MDIFEITKQYLVKKTTHGHSKYYYLPQHIMEVEKWAIRLCNTHPDANKMVVLLAVWLHDIGQIVGDPQQDHAVNSEIEARRFLDEQGADKLVIDQVCHCVRSHRCKDIQPQTLEAKIIACSDSCSHMTDFCYIYYAQIGRLEEAKIKLERDYRDTSFFPELKSEIKPLYLAWKQLLKVYPKTNQ